MIEIYDGYVYLTSDYTETLVKETKKINKY